MAIFAFAILAIIGLLSQALNVSGDTQRDSSLATLIRTLDADIRAAATPTAVSNLTTTPRHFDIVGKPVSATNNAAYYRVNFIHTNQSPASQDSLKTLFSLNNTAKLNVWSATIAYPAPAYTNQTVVLFSNTNP